MLSAYFRRSFQKQLEEHRSSLYKVAWSWCHNTDLAHDLVQETYLKALKNRSQLKDINKLKPWLMRILVNVHIDHLRKKRELLPLEDKHTLELNDPTIEMGRADNVLQVRNAIALLSDEHRKVITLVDLAEFSYAEVAETLDVPAGTVMSRLSRARTKLKQHLQDKSLSTPFLKRVK